MARHRIRGPGRRRACWHRRCQFNVLALDGLPVGQKGEPLDPRGVISRPFRDGQPVLPECVCTAYDPFLRQLAASGRKWGVLTDATGEPRLVTSASNVLCAALFGRETFHPYAVCHPRLIVRNVSRPFGQVLGRLTVQAERTNDDVIDKDLILVWTGRERRIITSSDLLGRLLRKIARQAAV
jgi:hypothetical protein